MQAPADALPVPPQVPAAAAVAQGPVTAVTVGESVLVNPDTPEGLPYIAFVKGVNEQPGGGTTLEVAWYYRPEESVGGRKPFHGARELFLSDHSDSCALETVIGRCRVHTLEDFQKLPSVSAHDYFSRFTYFPAKREYVPDRVPIFCLCEQPYNPDRFMAMCDVCEEWFHPECVNTPQLAMQSLAWACPQCSGAAAGGGAAAAAFGSAAQLAAV